MQLSSLYILHALATTHTASDILQREERESSTTRHPLRSNTIAPWLRKFCSKRTVDGENASLSSGAKRWRMDEGEAKQMIVHAANDPFKIQLSIAGDIYLREWQIAHRVRGKIRLNVILFSVLHRNEMNN